MKIIFSLMLLLCLIAPAQPSQAQFIATDNTETTVQADEGSSNSSSSTKEKKSDKKKDKDKIEINLNFLWYILIDISTLALILLLVYYPGNKQIESIFTFMMFNILIFMLTYVLNEVKISMGAAFGLFAVFSMLRYRTEGISMKDMTYLFIFIATGLISAIQLEFYELAIINGTIVVFTIIFDSRLIFKREHSKIVEYENIELVNSDNKAALMEDITRRTGLKIHRVNIEKINFLRDTATIKIYYYE
jgi:hypothetical protein